MGEGKKDRPVSEEQKQVNGGERLRRRVIEDRTI
jgi:hypothetical protein